MAQLTKCSGALRGAALPRARAAPLVARPTAPLARMVAAAAAPVPEAAPVENFDDIDWTEDLPTPVRRRVAALREVQSKQDEIMRGFIQERAELEVKYQKQLAPLLDERAAVVAGKKEVGKFDVPDSDEEDAGIPEFWLTAMTNHEMVGELVTERDAEVLAYLTDVRVTSLTGEDAGSFRITFEFAENPFFSNKTLEKTFLMEDPDEVVPRKFVGTQNPDDLSEEDLEALQEAMDEDYEVGVAFKESLAPRAVEWFTGEAAPPLYGADEEGFDEGEFE
ncbi:hypothetical protein Rsub_09135 [Raphidocelis subcapitata]|uniref:Nucleosome assembly protein n=1 Tax=Raphidocelis subcapitata TaxID=307507 RepID=A0A2V0PC89_9CHLO|nr:hypothetical protein Rsub_09135 [Raphidocelis subcapitata]|eukprot:GBF96552.1 hypothetical protein Rsub_09135 [Raphidocelis subcapitata]